MRAAYHLDRNIEIANVPTPGGKDKAGAPLKSLSNWVVYPAQKETSKASDNYAQGQLQPVAHVSFVIDFEDDFKLPKAVRHENQVYQIRGVEEIGYREYLRLLCESPRAYEAV